MVTVVSGFLCGGSELHGPLLCLTDTHSLVAFDLTPAEGTGLAIRLLGTRKKNVNYPLVFLLTSNAQSDVGREGWRELSSGMGGRRGEGWDGAGLV